MCEGRQPRAAAACVTHEQGALPTRCAVPAWQSRCSCQAPPLCAAPALFTRPFACFPPPLAHSHTPSPPPPFRKKYIEEQLARRLGRSQDAAQDAAQPSGRPGDADVPLPESLRVGGSMAAGRRGARRRAGTASGALAPCAGLPRLSAPPACMHSVCQAHIHACMRSSPSPIHDTHDQLSASSPPTIPPLRAALPPFRPHPH